MPLWTDCQGAAGAHVARKKDEMGGFALILAVLAAVVWVMVVAAGGYGRPGGNTRVVVGLRGEVAELERLGLCEWMLAFGRYGRRNQHIAGSGCRISTYDRPC